MNFWKHFSHKNPKIFSLYILGLKCLYSSMNDLVNDIMHRTPVNIGLALMSNLLFYLVNVRNIFGILANYTSLALVITIYVYCLLHIIQIICLFFRLKPFKSFGAIKKQRWFIYRIQGLSVKTKLSKWHLHMVSCK